MQEWRRQTEPNRWLTHATVLTEDFDEVKGVETQQQDQLVLTLSVVAGSLSRRDSRGGLGGKRAQLLLLGR